MEWWLPIVGGVSIATGLWRLRRSGSRDVLGAVVFAALGVSLGAVLSMVFPGALAVGTVGGAALAWTRLDAVRTSRRALWQESVKQAGSPAEVRLALHDRLDALASVESRHARVTSLLAVSALALGSVLAMTAGLFFDSPREILLAVGLGFLPTSVAAQRSIEAKERREVSRMLDRINDP